jgi:hypothetical protein
MSNRNCLILSQYREGDLYNDFIGKFYHFPSSSRKNYLNQFDNLPIEVIFYEPEKEGKGEFYSYGKIIKSPFADKREPDHYFVEISDYRPFSKPVYFKNNEGEILEKIFNKENYNYNNAVRKINPRFLDEICLDGGIILNFKADAHLVKVLGEQLIESERIGILELVKNAFDAGASYCRVRIEKIPNLPFLNDSLNQYNEFEGPVIVIEDDGSGMTKEDIEMGWLRPASTIKTNIKERLVREREIALKTGKIETFDRFISILKKEHKGRIPLGEKGVGRFAAHRLGKNLLIKTKIVQNDYEYIVQINWNDFDAFLGTHKDLDSVGIVLTRQALSRDYGSNNSGTQLIIYGGRDGFALNEEEIKQINRSLNKLNSPFPNPNSNIPAFRTLFECPQVKHLDENISIEKYEPVFKIYGLISETGEFEYDFFFDPPYNEKIPLPSDIRRNKKENIKKYNKDYFLKTIDGRRLWKKTTCGPFYIHLNIWYRDRPWLDKSDEDFLEYLKNYGGLSIYRDGINVFPSDWSTKNDWLGLSQRQISQAFRLSYYHMLGNIEIEQTINFQLIDKTNREGMLNNEAFNDLRAFVKAIVLFVELDYIGKRDELNKLTGGFIRNPKVLDKFSKQSSKIISNIHDKYDVSGDPYLLLQELGDISERKGKLVELSKSFKKLEDNLKQMEGVQDMLTEQAGFGLGIAVALHEINKSTSNFYYGVLEILKSGKFDEIKLDDLLENSKVLESELLRLQPLRALRNEEPILYNVSKSISYIKSVFERRFLKFGISFTYSENEDFKVLCKFGALNQILTNLIENACYWLDDPSIQNKKIHIEIDSVNRSIIVADSGSGISEAILPYLFQPGYSLKEPPSGLGLYICKHYMNLMKKRGDIYLTRDKDRIKDFPGAQFYLDFSKVNYEENEK